MRQLEADSFQIKTSIFGLGTFEYANVCGYKIYSARILHTQKAIDGFDLYKVGYVSCGDLALRSIISGIDEVDTGKLT